MNATKNTGLMLLREYSGNFYKNGFKAESDALNEALSQVEAEHAALVAVAEAAKGFASIGHDGSEKLDAALDALAAVRAGSEVAK